MNGIAYKAKFFETEEAAERFKAENGGGAIYDGAVNSKTRTLHLQAAAAHNFDPVQYPFSVNWAEYINNLPGNADY